jgi:hypothetical protein
MDIHEIALLLFLLVITEVTVWFGLEGMYVWTHGWCLWPCLWRLAT